MPFRRDNPEDEEEHTSYSQHPLINKKEIEVSEVPVEKALSDTVSCDYEEIIIQVPPLRASSTTELRSPPLTDFISDRQLQASSEIGIFMRHSTPNLPLTTNGSESEQEETTLFDRITTWIPFIEHQRPNQGSSRTAVVNGRETTSTANRITIDSKDGVFFNLVAKPDCTNNNLVGLQGEVPTYSSTITPREPTETLPIYSEVGTFRPPEYDGDITATTSYLYEDLEDVEIQGLSVGSKGVFVFTLIMAYLFQFFGFMMTFFLATSHAARYGSLAGLGLALSMIAISPPSKYHPHPLPVPPGTIPQPPPIVPQIDPEVSFFFLVFGLTIALVSTLIYFKIRKNAKIYLATFAASQTV